MAAVSLFWNTNMAAVTSCENALYLRPRLQNLANGLHENLKQNVGSARGRSPPFQWCFYFVLFYIDLFTDTAAILNQFDLKVK